MDDILYVVDDAHGTSSKDVIALMIVDPKRETCGCEPCCAHNSKNKSTKTIGPIFFVGWESLIGSDNS